MENFGTDLIAFLLGLIMGSFVGLCAYRIPRRKSVVFGPSRCDNCGAPLGWLHKLPLVGYLIVRGRSRCCGKPISYRYPILEIVTGIFFVLIYRHSPGSAILFPTITFLVLVLLGMLIDLDHRIIPDKITLTGMVVGLLLAGIFSQPGLEEALLGILICGGFLYLGGRLGEAIFSKANAMGGGDIKFAAMIGAFLGWQPGLVAVIIAAVVGTAFGLVQILTQGNSLASRELPFGPFLALGALTSLFCSNVLLSWYFGLG